MMIVINFSHPFTPAHLAQLETTFGPIERQIEVPVSLDEQEPFAGQLERLVQSIGLTSREWQTEAIAINPPAYAPIAITLLPHLHALTGHFPAIIRMRPIRGAPTPRYEVAEIINLNNLRNDERARSRYSPE